MADDIVQVAGDYYSFLPFNRELSEEFFTSFALRSNSLEQLKDEIGSPNIDPYMGWDCYYRISENRYVDCYFMGDVIEKFSVVDSKERLYTIWEAEDTEN